MSISFKINKVKDTGGKPTVFERLGMKSSKICPNFLKTGHCNLGSKCSFEHQKKPTEESSEKISKTDSSKVHSKLSKKNKKENQKELTPTKNKEKDSSKKKYKESTKSSKKSKEEVSEKAKSPIPIEKQKKRELIEKPDKKPTEVSSKNKKISKEDEGKRLKSEHKKDEKVKKRRHHSSSSRSSPSASRIKRPKIDPKSKKSNKNSSPYSSKHGYNQSPSQYKRHVPSHSRHIDDRDEYMLRKEMSREKWERRMERREEEGFKNIMSEQRWSEERYSPHKSRDREHRDERAMMEAKMSKKMHRRSEERFLKDDAYRGYRDERLVHRGSPNLYRSKHDKETYHSSDDSISNYGSRERRSDGYRGSMRRSRSKSSRGSRYYEKGDSMNRGRLSAGMPSHISPMQPLPPPPSSFFYNHNNMSLPGKMMPLGKTAGHHGSDFWEERRLSAGLVGAMSLPQFRMPLPSYRMPLSHFSEYRMPPPLNNSFPVRASSPVDDFKSRKTPKPTSFSSKTFEETTALERQPMTNFKLSLYHDLSEEENESGEGTNEEEEKDECLSGLDNDDDLSDTNSELPLKIPLVETSDVEWSLLSSSAVKVADSSLLQNVSLNPLDELGLSRKLAGDQLFEEMRNVNFNYSATTESADGNQPTTKNGADTKVLENDEGFLNDIALYHVDMRKRKKKLKGLVNVVASMDQAMFARKDLYLRRMLCQLPEEEDMIYPGLAQKADIYKTAVILFES